MLLGFARALRTAGLPVTADRERAFLRAAAEVGAGNRAAVYWAGRCTLTAAPADLGPYDQIFTSWFGGESLDAVTHREMPRVSTVQVALTDGGTSAEDATDQTLRAAASEVEVLRRRDVAGLAPGERAALQRLFATLRPCPPTRPARRRTPTPAGELDGRASLRAQLRGLGEPTRLRHRRRRTRPRRVVLLVDVSGSMSAYSDALLRLAHAVVRAAPRTTEAFTLGTRLTHVTRALRQRDPDRALLDAGASVPDWSGGTRLGETLGAFLDRWGRRGLARQAVVVVFSDGWERHGPELLGEQVRRLHRIAHRVIWVNPHRGKAGYRPVQQGMVAALPYVDEFVAGHSLATFEDLLDLVARA